MYNNICPNCFGTSNAETGACENCGYDQSIVKKNNLAIPPISILNARYLIGRVLGQGGFGITYLAKDMRENRLVAIKECVPESFAYRASNLALIAKDNEQAAFKQCKMNFISETRALYRLRGNPFIVEATDYFSENNTEYFVMEYIDGVTLKYLTHKRGGLTSYENALLIFLTVGSTLMEVHRHGIIHRDISPENIMIAKDGDIKLIDFGACRDFINHRSSENDSIFLKPGFAPPEQYTNNDRQGPWTDIYALGATFYTIVSGQPLVDSTYRLEEDPMKELRDINPEIPTIVSDAVKKSMEPQIQNRYESVEKFLNDMAPAAQNADHIDSKTLSFIKDKQETPYKSFVNSQNESIKFPYVEVVSGKSRGKQIKIPDYGFICIGRDPNSADLAVDDLLEISRQHCLVGYDRSKNHFVIVDKSYNGTYFNNGQRMLYNAECYIEPNSRFLLYSDEVQILVKLM